MADLEALDARLAAAAGALREQEHADRVLAELDQVLQEHETAISELVVRVDLEQRDVSRLEGLTLDRVIAGLRGSRGDDLARERAEADAAGYRLAERRARRDHALREHAVLMERRTGRSGAAEEYRAALAAKEAFLTAGGDPRAGELLDLATQRGVLEAEIREVDDALAAARDAATALRDVDELLGSAGGWSVYDTWLGGGVISSAVKHDRLDRAQRAAAFAESRLAALRRELADVRDRPAAVNAALGVGELTRFVDIWLDNIFTDWSVATRIRDAQESTATAARAVASAVSSLGRHRQELVSRAGHVARRREEILSVR